MQFQPIFLASEVRSLTRLRGRVGEGAFPPPAALCERGDLPRKRER